MINKKVVALPDMFKSIKDQSIITVFFSTTFPALIELLKNPQIFPPDEVQELKQNLESLISLNPKECLFLLFCSFLCIPLGSKKLRDTTFIDFFVNQPKQVAKLECMIRYFNRSCTIADTSDRRIEFIRISKDLKTDEGFRGSEWWCNSSSPLTEFQVRPSTERIEDATDCIQADFANRYVGGGVLNLGCVQEEIRFMISPELIIASLISEPMLDHEAVLVRNSFTFVEYTGYDRSFKCVGDKQLLTPSDVLCIDALPFGINVSFQYEHQPLLRELEKIRCALSLNEKDKRFATGNWGCGVFNGDPQLKAVLQWVAASVRNTKIVYFPFDDPRLTKLTEFVNLATSRKLKVGQIATLLFSTDPKTYSNGLLTYLIDYFKPIAII
jgi:poly(ADP-ribose) glycohydrolase